MFVLSVNWTWNLGALWKTCIALNVEVHLVGVRCVWSLSEESETAMVRVKGEVREDVVVVVVRHLVVV